MILHNINKKYNEDNEYDEVIYNNKITWSNL